MIRFARTIATCLLAVAAGGLHAQTMYRCGKTFQDRPCENGVTEQRIIPGSARSAATSATPGTSSSPFAAECSRRGEHAQRITWQREGGATAERQINDARGNQEMIDLIQNVYARRGSAPEIRAAVEKECVVEKQKAADAAAALATLQKQAGTAAPAAIPAAAAQPSDAGAQPKPVATNTGPNPACEGLRRQKDDVDARSRRGGSVQTMESLQRERREVDQKLSDAKC